MFYYFNAEMKYYEKPFTPDPILNNNSWEDIQKAAQLGIASEIWNVGDRKEIILNGTCRARTFNNYKAYAYILGFNHNAALESNNTITFQIGFYDLTDVAAHLALTDWKGSNSYGGTSGTRFCMNEGGHNTGGWKDSLMRTITIPEFISCLPSDLQNALKAVNKYTDNTGNASAQASDVTATQDKVFLLSEYEVFGARTWANQYEQNSQAQYDYYKNGNGTTVRNDQYRLATVRWWERSPCYGVMYNFCDVNSNGDMSNEDSGYSMGFAPAFVVG